MMMFPEKLKRKPDWKLIKDHLHKEGRIAKAELIKLVVDCNKILSITNLFLKYRE